MTRTGGLGVSSSKRLKITSMYLEFDREMRALILSLFRGSNLDSGRLPLGCEEGAGCDERMRPRTEGEIPYALIYTSIMLKKGR